METVLKAIADWIKGILTAGIMSNLSGLFDDVNTQVGNIAQQVGTKPSSFEPRVFAMIEALSRNVVLPIAGIILTFIACYELIEMITQHNNMAQFEPALIMRWIFKTAVSVWFISNTFDIVMAVFDVTQKVVSDSSSIIAGNTHGNLRQPRAKPHGAELSEMPVCAGLSGLLDFDLCCHLRCADPVGSDFRGCHQLHLEHCGLYRSALLQPVQDQLGHEKCAGRALREVLYWLRISLFPVI